MSGHANQPDDHVIRAAGGRRAATYLAECFWPGVTATKLAQAAARAAGDAEATCIELILIPGDEIVLGVFEAPSEAAVTQASRRAGLPSERVVKSLHVRPHRIGPLPTLDDDRSPHPTRQPPPDHSDRHH